MHIGRHLTISDLKRLSELLVDCKKNWLGYGIANVADPEDDQDVATRLWALNLLLDYLPLLGGTMEGAIDMGAFGIVNAADPVNDQDLATKLWVLTQALLYLPLAGGTMAGDIDMGAFGIVNMNDGSEDTDAATVLQAMEYKTCIYDFTDSSPVRELDTAYENNTAHIMVVVVTVQCEVSASDGGLVGSSQCVAQTGATNNPITEVASAGHTPGIALAGLTATLNYIEQNFTLTFMVKPGYWYRVLAGHAGDDGKAPTKVHWREYILF